MAVSRDEIDDNELSAFLQDIQIADLSPDDRTAFNTAFKNIEGAEGIKNLDTAMSVAKISRNPELEEQVRTIGRNNLL